MMLVFGYLLHGARTGASDTAFDTAMLFVPVGIMVLMVAGPRMLRWWRGDDEPDAAPDEIDEPVAAPRHQSKSARARAETAPATTAAGVKPGSGGRKASAPLATTPAATTAKPVRRRPRNDEPI